MFDRRYIFIHGWIFLTGIQQETPLGISSLEINLANPEDLFGQKPASIGGMFVQKRWKSGITNHPSIR